MASHQEKHTLHEETAEVLASERRRLKELEEEHTELTSSKAALEGELLQNQETLATQLYEARAQTAAVEETYGLERLQSQAALEGERERSKALEEDNSSAKAALEAVQAGMAEALAAHRQHLDEARAVEETSALERCRLKELEETQAGTPKPKP